MTLWAKAPKRCKVKRFRSSLRIEIEELGLPGGCR